jgi:hypothetical protein
MVPTLIRASASLKSAISASGIIVRAILTNAFTTATGV